jgi:predicted permease
MSFEIDGPILGFILAASVLSALAAGLMPALRSASVSVREVLQDESRGASSRSMGRLSQAMVVLTMALAYPLLVCSALLISSFQETTGEMGFDRENVLVVQVSLPSRRYTDETMRHAFRDDFITWAEGRPEVTAAAWANWIPGAFAGRWQFAQEGTEYLRDEDHPAARLAYLRPGFLEMLGVAPLRGRLFDDRDRTGPPAALVNEAFASRFFEGQDPLGRRIRITGEEEYPWHTVVGVVPNLRMNGSDQDMPEGFYFPSPPIDVGFGYFFLRSDADPQALAPGIRTHLSEVDPELPIQRMDTLDDRIQEFFWFVAVIGSTFTTFGAAALFLASVGLYGVMSHSVSRRTREMGVRMAMGATRGSIIRVILAGGMAQVGLGLAVGGILAWSGSRLITEALFGVRPGDPATMLKVAVVLVAAALVAMMVPAVRATRRGPVEALRVE